MKKIRELIRLYEVANLSQRAISRTLGISRPVVSEYISKIRKAGLDYKTINTMDDDTLLQTITDTVRVKNDRYNTLREQFDTISKELQRPGVTLERLWHEYRQQHPDGYSYTQFCYHYQVWRNSSELTMHIPHKAGDKMFVDFAGKKLEIIDKHTGEVKEVEVFIAVLGASQYTYVEAVASQKKHDWIKVNQNAFYFFEGVPQAIVPDCLKSAVQKSNPYEPDINPEYADFARHHQTTILPARPNRPKDKALVEGAVRIVYTRIYAALRNQIFHSIPELNNAIHRELKTYNAIPMQKLNTSRKQLFDEIETKALNALPTEKYEIRTFKSLKAQFNYHIYLSEDKHYYSVPYRYRAKQLTVIFTDSSVEIFYKNNRIAIHKRNRTPNGYSTITEHMPKQHQQYGDWSPQRFKNWAAKIGPHVETVINTILSAKKHPEQAYKTCMGILKLATKYDNSRLNSACEKAIEFDYISYKGIKYILEKNLDNYQQELFQSHPDHNNIRGQHYYQ
jgi:transposase